MANRDSDIDVMLGRAKWLEEHGERAQALELYGSALAQMGEDDPRRNQIETAISYLEVGTVLAIEPAQKRAWGNLTGQSRKWRLGRWGVVVVLVLFEIGMLLIGKSLDLRARSGVAILPATGTPGLDEAANEEPRLQLALAPTPLAPLPTGTDSPTFEPTPTETSVPSPTVTPTAKANPANPAGGNQGVNPAANGGSPTPSAPSGPAPTPQPPSGPPPGPTMQPPPGPQPTPGPGPGGPGGSGGNGGGANHGGNGKGNGNGGGGGKGRGKGGH